MNNRLYRSPDDRVFAGVAGGMAETYDFDPALVRLVWALLVVFTGGAFLVVYIVMALVVPLRPYGWTPPAFASAMSGPTQAAPGPVPSAGAPDPATATMPSTSGDPGPRPGPAPSTPWSYQTYRRRYSGNRGGAWVIGALFIIAGLYLLVQQFYPLFDIGRFWPLIFILIGVALLATAFGRRSA